MGFDKSLENYIRVRVFAKVLSTTGLWLGNHSKFMTKTVANNSRK